MGAFYRARDITVRRDVPASRLDSAALGNRRLPLKPCTDEKRSLTRNGDHRSLMDTRLL